MKTILYVLFFSLSITFTLVAQESKRPDIVFIIVDDLNDYVGYLGGHPQTISPNLDSFAKKNMIFPQAYCNSPQCGPSRASLNTGRYPFNSGRYFNRVKANSKKPTPDPDFKKKPYTGQEMQKFFMSNGYKVVSGGKVYHGGPGRHGDVLFDRPKDPDKFGAGKVPCDGYALKRKDEEMGDYKVASWAIDQWKTVSEKPLFMSVGFYRPHRPLQVPKPYFDLFPLDKIQRPAKPKVGDDWDDMPQFARDLARTHAHKPPIEGLSDHEYIVKHEKWDETLQAYLACIAFVDKQIGRFLDTLEKNPRGRETVVILVSDHGWHLGEKKHWCKAAIWEQTTRIPFIVKAPGVKAGKVCPEPVSLIDVYPSLVDLAGIEVPSFLEGNSIKPQILDPATPRSPAISSYGHANTAIRSRDWRYIRYEDGSEELYDHRKDPNEWTNLASNPEYENVKKKLAESIPKSQVPSVFVQGWFEQFKKKKASKK